MRTPSHLAAALTRISNEHIPIILREKLCSGGECGTSGIATVGGMCSSQSYAVVEDFGLSRGHTIAHEFGHL